MAIKLMLRDNRPICSKYEIYEKFNTQYCTWKDTIM